MRGGRRGGKMSGRNGGVSGCRRVGGRCRGRRSAVSWCAGGRWTVTGRRTLELTADETLVILLLLELVLLLRRERRRRLSFPSSSFGRSGERAAVVLRCRGRRGGLMRKERGRARVCGGVGERVLLSVLRMRRLSALLLLLLSVVLLLLLLLLEVRNRTLRIPRLRNRRVELLLLLLLLRRSVVVRPVAVLLTVRRRSTVDPSAGELVEVDLFRRDASARLFPLIFLLEKKAKKRTFNPLPLNSNPLNIPTALSAS
jgi:hypothetical protein